MAAVVKDRHRYGGAVGESLEHWPLESADGGVEQSFQERSRRWKKSNPAA